jgi:hypothetical protein
MSATSPKIVHRVTKKSEKGSKGKVPAEAASAASAAPAEAASAASAAAKPVVRAKGKAPAKSEGKAPKKIPTPEEAVKAWLKSFKELALKQIVHDPHRAVAQIAGGVARAAAEEYYESKTSEEAKEFIKAFVKGAIEGASSMPVYQAALELYRQFNAGKAAAAGMPLSTVNGRFGHVVLAFALWIDGKVIFVNVNLNGARTPDHVPAGYSHVRVNHKETPFIAHTRKEFQQQFLDQMPEGFSFTGLLPGAEKSKGYSRLEANPGDWESRPANLQAAPEKKA